MPTEFVRGRNSVEAALRDAGHHREAAAVRRLRKPTTAVWALNQVARRKPNTVEAFVKAVHELSQAQRTGRRVAESIKLERVATEGHPPPLLPARGTPFLASTEGRWGAWPAWPARAPRTRRRLTTPERDHDDLVRLGGLKAEDCHAAAKRQRPPEAHPVIVTAPGEEGQADYGTGPMVRPPETRTYRRTRLFVFTLDYSRKSVRLFLFKSSTRRWAARALEASADVEPGGVAVASVRLRTPAAKRFKKVENATAVIWKTLLVAEKTFRRLDAPELLADVWNDVICVNGVRGVNRGEKKAAA